MLYIKRRLSRLNNHLHVSGREQISHKTLSELIAKSELYRFIDVEHKGRGRGRSEDFYISPTTKDSVEERCCRCFERLNIVVKALSAHALCALYLSRSIPFIHLIRRTRKTKKRGRFMQAVCRRWCLSNGAPYCPIQLCSILVWSCMTSFLPRFSVLVLSLLRECQYSNQRCNQRAQRSAHEATRRDCYCS